MPAHGKGAQCGALPEEVDSSSWCRAPATVASKAGRSLAGSEALRVGCSEKGSSTRPSALSSW
jgi:hypothetical protein